MPSDKCIITGLHRRMTSGVASTVSKCKQSVQMWLLRSGIYKPAILMRGGTFQQGGFREKVAVMTLYK